MTEIIRLTTKLPKDIHEELMMIKKSDGSLSLSDTISRLVRAEYLRRTQPGQKETSQQKVKSTEEKRPVGRPPTKATPETAYDTWLNQGDADPEGKHYKGLASLSVAKKERLMQITEDQRKDWVAKMIYLYADKQDEMSFEEFLEDKIA